MSFQHEQSPRLASNFPSMRLQRPTTDSQVGRIHVMTRGARCEQSPRLEAVNQANSYPTPEENFLVGQSAAWAPKGLSMQNPIRAMPGPIMSFHRPKAKSLYVRRFAQALMVQTSQSQGLRSMGLSKSVPRPTASFQDKPVREATL